MSPDLRIMGRGFDSLVKPPNRMIIQRGCNSEGERKVEMRIMRVTAIYSKYEEKNKGHIEYKRCQTVGYTA